MEEKVEKSRAWVALMAILGTKTQKELAEETGVPQPVLSMLSRLARLPNRRDSLRLQAVGIRPEWWDEPAASGSGEHPVAVPPGAGIDGAAE